MKMIKSLSSLLLAVVIAVSVSACGASHTCTQCQKTFTGDVYGNMLNASDRWCADCAQSYYTGMNIENFKIKD